MNTSTIARTPAISADTFIDSNGVGFLTLTFSNGNDLELNLGQLSPDIYQQAALHGLKQKLVDAAAISRDTLNGKSASIEDKYEAVKEVFDRITSPDGSWNKERESNAQGGGLLVQALMQMSGKEKKEIEEMLAAKPKDEVKSLRKHPKVAETMLAIQAAKLEKSGEGEKAEAVLQGFLS